MKVKQDLFSNSINTVPISATFMGKSYLVNCWEDILKTVIDKFAEKDSYILNKCIDDMNFIYYKRNIVSRTDEGMRNPYRIVKANLYIDILQNSEKIRDILNKLFNKFRIPIKELVIEVEKTGSVFDLSLDEKENEIYIDYLEIFNDEISNMKISSTYKPFIIRFLLIEKDSIYLKDLIDLMSKDYRALFEHFKIIEDNAKVFLPEPIDYEEVSNRLVRNPIRILQEKGIIEYNETYKLIKLKEAINDKLSEEDKYHSIKQCLTIIARFYINLKDKEIENYDNKICLLQKALEREKQPDKKFDLHNKLQEVISEKEKFVGG